MIFFFAIVTSIHNVLGEAKEQTATADSYLGRVMTTIRTSTQIGGPLMSVVAGVLLDHAGQNLLISGCTLLILLGGINMLLVKEG
ncbi:hypothetical protein [Lactobacillus xylocopicola]|uniref:hypothetical protein n=1 Tax=Lactobacillus xylocopicola TaxID=2976676 RepID=UPI002953795B|nr:hypothetical protein [Lactobacillus xylocopicola]